MPQDSKNKKSKSPAPNSANIEFAKKISELEAKNTELQDKLMRSVADYINLEKRIERDKEFIAALATTSILTQMTDVLDNFDLALKHLADPGLKMAMDKFLNVLREHGLTELNPVGQVFNPETMECVDVAPGDPDKVISVQKTGYLLNGRSLRPAKVIVGRKQNIKS